MKMRKHVRYVGVVLVLMLLLPSVAAAQGPTVEVVVMLDGSSSISGTNFGIMKQGLSAAVGNSQCVPQDGTVELTVIQFASNARLEVVPTVVDSTSVAGLQTAIAGDGDQQPGIQQLGGFTCIACAECLAQHVLLYHPSSQYSAGLKQALNLTTDGAPNRCHDCTDTSCNTGTGGPNTWYCDNTGCSDTNGDASAVAARNYAVAQLGLTTDQDEYDVEGIGITTTNRDWLKNNIIFPATGWSSPPNDWPPPEPGWVRVVGTWQEYELAICEKFQSVTPVTLVTFGARPAGPPTGVVVAILGLMGVALAVSALVYRRREA